ncbi:MAG: tetratricopeptide repeat protein, partial [Myxococcota bacterium]
RLQDRLFGPFRGRLAQKKRAMLVAGYLGQPVPGLVWPQDLARTHLQAASHLMPAKEARLVGGQGRLRLSGPEGSTKTAPLTDGPSLSTAEALAFRAPPREVSGPDSPSGRRPADTLPYDALELLVVEPPLRLQPRALERSAFVLTPVASAPDAFAGELPLGQLAVPARTVVLGRTKLPPGHREAALRLDASMALMGYGTAIVVPDTVPEAIARAVVAALVAEPGRSPAAVLAQAQDRLRASMPAVDLIFAVGVPGLNAAQTKQFAQRQLKSAQLRAVTALGRKRYDEAVPLLERWIRLQKVVGSERRIEGIYGALVGVLRERVQPPQPARAADVQRALIAAMAQSDVSAVRRADAQVDLAHLLSLAHEFESAEEAFGEAIEGLKRALGSKAALRLARAWFFYGQHKEEQRDYEGAAEMLERSISTYNRVGVFRKRQVPKDAKRALLAAGTLYLNRLGDPERARRAFERVRRKIRDPAAQISATIDLARAARRRGDFIAAAGHAERARRDAVDSDFVDLQLSAEIEAANVAWYQGDYRLGQQLCMGSLQLIDRLSAELGRKEPASKRVLPRMLSRRRTFALSVCGLVAMSQRDFDGAVEYLEEARRIAKRLGNQSEVSAQLNNLGRVYLEFGQLSAAVDAFRRAEAIDERRNDRYALAYDLRNLGRALALVGRYGEARSALTRALSYAREVRDANSELRALFALGQLDLLEGRTAEAVQSFRGALPLAQRLEVKELEWQIHRYLGRQARADGDLRRALEAMERSVQVARTITGRSAPSEFGPDRFEAFDELAKLRLEVDDPSEAFRTVEQARIIRRLELLSDRRIEGEVSMAPTLTGLRNGTITASQARAQLGALPPRWASIVLPPDALAASKRLPPDVAVVQYEMTEDTLLAFVFRREGLTVVT